METNTYISHLNRTSLFNDDEINQLKEICLKYPYFQSAKALYLKGLHQKRSFQYNKELKRTAAYTTDRDILFDFIVSDEFINYRPINVQDIDVYGEDIFEVKKHEPTLNENIEKTVLQTLVYIEDPKKETELIQKIDTIVQKKVDTKAESLQQAEIIENITDNVENIIVSDSNQLIENKIIEEKISNLEEKLEIGEPLEFQSNEKYSFTEWLQLTQMKPIEREKESSIINTPQIEEVVNEEILISEKKSVIIENISSNESFKEEEIFLKEESPIQNQVSKIEIIPIQEKTKGEIDSKKKKLEIIDRFIEANPKIIPSKSAPAPVINLEPTEENQPYFMTETLAKIYLEQKKFQKAIQAYEILILKYPEKSSLFADRISYIKELQQYNNL